jgi:hypothetical protein
MAAINFDATDIEPNAPRQLLPAGTYLMQVVASDMKTTKAGDGQYLELQLDVLDGEFRGRKLWERLNLVSSSPQAAEIAARQFSGLCRAAGKLKLRDSEELHFVPLLATVTVRPAGPDKKGVHREAQNAISSYAPAGGAPRQVTQMQRPAQAAPAAAPAAPTAVWRKPAA